MNKIKIICVVGTRPNFIKIAPLIKAFNHSGCINPILVHTGQHYDENMSDVFFRDLDIPKPDVNLRTKDAESHLQVIQIIARFNYTIDLIEPDYILVTGDVTSSFACAYTAFYKCIPVIHIESGQRSYDNNMPEEVNRVAIDRMSTLLFASRPSGFENLLHEGYHDSNIYYCGNILYDSLDMVKSDTDILNTLNFQPCSYNILTLHRPCNTDNIKSLQLIINEVEKVAQDKPVIFPVHPRTQKTLLHINTTDNIIKIEPLCYTDFITLVKHANMAITDSGGLQEETSILGIPCITLRNSTEWVESLQHGTNTLVKDISLLYNTYKNKLKSPCKGYNDTYTNVSYNITNEIITYHENVMHQRR